MSGQGRVVRVVVSNSLLNFIGRIGGNLFQVIFILAALAAVSITILAITGVDPTQPLSPGIIALLGINFILIAALAWLLVRRYNDLQYGEPSRPRGRLVRRFLLLFSLSSVLPATIIAVFLGGTINKALDNWFGERIETLVEQTANVARENFDRTFTQPLRTQAELMASDVAEAAEGLVSDPETYADYLFDQTLLRGLLAAYVVGPSGKGLASASPQNWQGFDAIAPSLADLRESASGGMVMRLHEQAGLTTALTPLDAPAGAHLFILKDYDPITFANLGQAQQALSDYRNAKGVSSRLQGFFIIGYTQVCALAVLLFARIGLEAAGRVTDPIERLAQAARSVRDGHLETRVNLPGTDDEIDALALAFNAMTAQLGEQRAALETARSVSEDRRQFLETLMSEMSAGVVRTDDALQITLANRSAEGLIGKGALLDRPLSDVVPEFQTYAIATVTDGIASDASVELKREGESRHIRLRTSGDGAGGCVLTFDDATRLVTAQRQLAWRDVARRIAHEIRNPLTPILLSAERLRRRYRDRLDTGDDVFDRSLETIIRQVNDIGRMVETFSNFARMPKPSLAVFDLAETLDEIIFSQRMVAPDFDIEVVRPQRKVLYMGDQRLLAQAFSNLVKNAVEAIGSLPVDSEVQGQIRVHIIEDDYNLTVHIEDNGPGFPLEGRDELLEPYVTTRDRGSGLGLAIVNRIMVDHGGSVSLQTRHDGLRGARVHIILPKQDPTLFDEHHKEAHFEEVTS